MRYEGPMPHTWYLIPVLIPYTFAFPNGFSFGNEIEVLAVAVVVLVAIGLTEEVAVAIVKESVRNSLKSESPFATNLVLDDFDGVVLVNCFVHPGNSEWVADLGAINWACGFHVLDTDDFNDFAFRHANAGHVVEVMVVKTDGLFVLGLKFFRESDGVEQFAIFESDEETAAVEAVEIHDGAECLARSGRRWWFRFATTCKGDYCQKKNRSHV